MRQLFSFDTETELLEPGCITPRLVCMSLANDRAIELYSAREAGGAFQTIAKVPDAWLIGHNTAYDAAVLSAQFPELFGLFFELYRDGRIFCTQIRQALLAIRMGDEMALFKLHLNDLVQKHLKYALNKGPDSWRLRYGALADIPIEDWPREAIDYAKGDAAATLDVFKAQALELAPAERFSDEMRQNRAAWVLQLCSAWGLKTDPGYVEELEAGLYEERSALLAELQNSGIMRSDGTRNLARVRELMENAFASKGHKAPRTDPSDRFPAGQIATSKEACEESGDPALIANSKLAHIDKLQETYVSALKRGFNNPICARYNVLVMSGRTSCREPNFQNLPRKDGIRESIIPRPGMVFIDCDYSSAELCALAQVNYSWFGFSKLRDAFIRGADPHWELAAKMTGLTVAEVKKLPDAKEKKVLAKIANFGFPGGLGPDSLVSFAKGYGVIMAVDERIDGRPSTRELKREWLDMWLEMTPYFQLIAEICSDYGDHRIEQYLSGRVRGNLAFCAAANTMFQGLIADAAKDALWEVAKACYCDDESPLYGYRIVAFIHDEIILEGPIAGAAEAGEELSRLMNSAAQRWMPDVPIASTPHLMDRWYKEAETTRDENGRLILWQPKKAA